MLPAPTPPSTQPSDDSVGRAALRKVSLRLLPIIGLGYGCAYIDRANISFASLQMNQDLHFSASVYGFGAGLFFLSYAACEVPSNLLLFRVGARRWLARIMFTWGIIAIGMMFVRTPVQFYIMRFLLGMAEAGFFPGVLFYLMQWFPADMRARTVSRFYVSLPLSTVVMGVLAGALLNLHGKLGLSGWQWLFLVEGLPPVLLSIAFLFLLPDTPAHAKWLTSEEKGWLQRQLQQEPGSNVHSANVSRALLDRRVLQISLLLFCMVLTTYAYTFSAPAILLKETGFSITNVGFLTALMGLLGALCMVLNAMHSDRAREKYLHVAVPFGVMAVGYFVAGVSGNSFVVVLAIIVTVLCFYLIQGPVWAIPFSFLKGKSAAAGIAAINTVAILGGFVGPYWMGLMKDLTGTYRRGLLSLTIPSLICAVMILVMRRNEQLSNPSAKQ